MIKLADYRTEDAFPSEMKTASRCAAAYAFDQEKKRILEAKKRVLIWASLENVPDDKLDVLAVENRVLFYNSGLDPSIKRQLIQNSIYWYMKLGTRQAMEEMIDIVFQNDNSSVEEWYTYAGEAFHFRIAVGTNVSQTSITEFLRYLNTVKNARSRFDYLVFQNGTTLFLYPKSDYQSFFYTFCGEMECGTYPNTEIGAEFTEVQIDIVPNGDSAGSVIYTETGTTPDISVGAALSENQIDIQTASDDTTIVYPTDSEAESGTAPDISIGAQFTEVQIDVQGDSDGSTIVYPADSEAESGDYPETSIGFAQVESGVSLSPEGENFDLYYNTDAAKEAAEE
jgi:P2-related tail formation protein